MTDKMTIQEAITELNECYLVQSDDDGRRRNKAVTMAIESLEKQIPKEPIEGYKVKSRKFKQYARCPNCREWVSEHHRDRDGYDINKYYRHCLSCGQAIDWESDTDEL